ncbi:MAG: protein kinase domain-containing protein [Thermoproteus sp.]
MSGLLEVGAVLGDKYVVKKLLGKGGMAIVWLAERKDGLKVAVKEPIISGEPEEKVRRNIQFVEHEGRILEMLNSPYICRLYDVKRGRVGAISTILLFLEYLDGGSLRELREPVDSNKLRDIAIQIFEGLAEVHKAGVVHRDVKPSNIMRSGDAYKLVDFGTAVYHFEKATHIVVSPGGYTAPEQLTRGLSVPQADVWSAGATLVWAYTLKHPYKFIKGYEVDKIVGELQVNIPSTYDDLMDKFLARTLEPDYRKRFSDAVEALNFLKGVSTKEKVGLKIRIKGTSIYMTGGRLIVGRTEDKALDLKIEGERLYIYDPQKYISREHAEIAEIGGRWLIRDSGSTNRTAIYRDGNWKVLWKGRGKPSQWEELRDGDIIAFGYDDEKGAYITAKVEL